jgi:hypothetical protein
MTGGPWDAFWRDFEALRSSLAVGGREAAARDLEDARGYVFGLADGWADCLTAMRRARGRHTLTPEQEEVWKRIEAIVERAVYRH